MEELLKQLRALEAAATAKLSELKDGTGDEAARKIEADHEKLLADIAAKRAEIALEERSAEGTRETRAAQTPAVDVRAAAESAVRAERERASTIRSLASAARAADLGETAANEGTTVEAFRGQLLEHLMARENETPTNGAVRAIVGTEQVEKRAAVIEGVLAHRADSRNEAPTGANEFRGMSLVEMAREMLEAGGTSTRGMSKMEIATLALEPPARGQRTGGMHTTTDFPGILGNVVNRTLRAGYTAAPQTFRPFVREVTVSDFKTVTRQQLGEAPRLEKVNEHGEFKRGTLGEGSEAYKIATYGKIIGITRQALINDDIGAFTGIAQRFGFSAAQLESDLVWAQILANPIMGDGVALFHASHKNLGTATAFGVAPLGKLNTAMAKQVGLDGKTVLNITPSFIVVPAELQVAAEQLLATPYTPATAATATPNSISRLTVIAEARLDNGFVDPATGTVIAGSSTAYYTIAAPGAIDTVELAYLEGARGVYTESKMGFNVDGIEIKARLDAGAKAIDWRAFQKNVGA